MVGGEEAESQEMKRSRGQRRGSQAGGREGAALGRQAGKPEAPSHRAEDRLDEGHEMGQSVEGAGVFWKDSVQGGDRPG